MGNDGLAPMAEALGLNDDNLLMPVRVARSTFPQHDRGPAELAAKGNGLAGITATPLEMARVMGVIANGGRAAPSAGGDPHGPGRWERD